MTTIPHAQQVLSPLADPGQSVVATEDSPAAKPSTVVKSDATASKTRTSPITPPAATVPPAAVTASSIPKPPEAKPIAESKPAAEPMPKPIVTEPPHPNISKQELTKLGRALQKARDAIADHEFDLANEFLALAEKMPQLPKHTAKIERLKLLLDAVRQYRQAINASISKLEVGVTFDIKDTVVAVVEASRDKVVFRAAGRNQGYLIQDLPPTLAAVLAELTLPEKDPSTNVLKGAYILSRRKASPAELAQARSLLEEAASSDDTAKVLLPIFEDSYDLSNDAPEN